MVFMANLMRVLTIACLLLLIAMPIYGYACPVCYGAPDSPLTAGMNMAIFTLLGITGSLLSTFIVFFIYLKRKAAGH